MREAALVFGEATPLVGVMTDPPAARCGNHPPAAILLNAGIMHRVGPNRLYVKIARSLASLGLVVLRFDFSGIGDSPVRSDHLPFRKSALRETQEAMSYLSTVRGSEQFVLMGICSGAAISYRMACRDPRVVGAVLINPWGHLHDGADDGLNSDIRNRALARHYWRIALRSSFRGKNWRKAFTGKADYRSIVPVMLGSELRGLFARGRSESSGVDHVAADLRLLAERGVRLLHVFSEGDEGLDYFHMILGGKQREWSKRGWLDVKIIRGANHTFTLLWSQEYLLRVIREWAQAVVQG